MKIIYIAHPISGDTKGNLEKIRLIARHIMTTDPNIVAFAPYWFDCHVLNDDIPEERQRGINNGIELFNRKFIDEVWLFGDRISAGMRAEIQLAQQLGIPVVNKLNMINTVPPKPEDISGKETGTDLIERALIEGWRNPSKPLHQLFSEFKERYQLQSVSPYKEETKSKMEILDKYSSRTLASNHWEGFKHTTVRERYFELHEVLEAMEEYKSNPPYKEEVDKEDKEINKNFTT